MKLSPTERVTTSVDRPLYPTDNRIIVDFNIYDFEADEVSHLGGHVCIRQSDKDEQFNIVVFNANGDVVSETTIPYEFMEAEKL